MRPSPARFQHGGLEFYVRAKSRSSSPLLLPQLSWADQCKQVIYTAATVLLAKRLQPLGKHHIPCADTQDDAWERAIQMLQAYSRVSQSAQRCIAALEILLAKVQNSGLNRSSEGGNMERRLPLDEVHRASVLDEPTPLGRGEDVDASMDFGGLDFNIDDMFWLNAPLTDFLF
jgi:hypothetical protein